MSTISAYFYNGVALPLFTAGIRAYALVNAKARKGIVGRKDLFASLEQQVKTLGPGKRIWFHSSSMGEFEQAKPIIAALKKKHDTVRIIVSFFSPSGYEHSRNYRFADLMTYIPVDTRANAARFIDLLRPDAAVFVRYDVWPNHIDALHKRRIPVFLANATMRPNSPRLRWPWRGFHRRLYASLNAILTVSEPDAERFRGLGLPAGMVTAAGETRYDQVLQRSAEARAKHVLKKQILRGRKVVVAGSTWPEDEERLLPAFRKLHHYDPRTLMILVPHEPTLDAIEEIERLLGVRTPSIRFSELNDYAGEPVIIVDSIGILMSLYQYADVAFVGGSFRQNVHNVLEPAVYGIPVVFGPKFGNSQEAAQLAERGGGFVVEDQQDLYRTLRSLVRDDGRRKAAGAASEELVREHAGATRRFLEYLEPSVWPPPVRLRPRQRKASKRKGRAR